MEAETLERGPGTGNFGKSCQEKVSVLQGKFYTVVENNSKTANKAGERRPLFRKMLKTFRLEFQPPLVFGQALPERARTRESAGIRAYKTLLYCKLRKSALV